MTWKVSQSLRGSTIAAAAGLLFGLTIGGCPVAQTPQALSDNTNNNNSSSSNSNSGSSNSNTIQRPIPPVPIDVNANAAANGNGPSTTTGDFFQPIAIAITAPSGFDINVAPGGDGLVTYETGGGNPSDGPLSVELFYDLDGIARTGDEVTLLSGLAPRGSQRFTANLPAGTYRLGVKAANKKDSKVVYATGKLVVVGTPAVRITQPSADIRVRPNSSFQMQLAIDSLASALTYDVLIDTDTTINGNERKVFTGAGLGGNVTVVTDGLAAGNYLLAVRAQDSVGQSKTEYNKSPQGQFRKVTIDLEPSISVLSPTSFDPTHPVPFELRVRAQDPEGNATVTLFQDGDAGFNGNEIALAAFQLTSNAAQEFSIMVDPATLTPGTYRYGASIDDHVGTPFFAFSPVPIPKNGPPRVSITLPVSETHVVYGSTFELRWDASDFEGRALAGFEILFAIDADGDGAPDDTPQPISSQFGPIVLDGTTRFLQFDTNGNPGALTAIDPLGTTACVVGIRAIDDLGATSDAFAPVIVSVEQPACCFADGTCGTSLSAQDCEAAGGCRTGGLTTPCAGVSCPVMTACSVPGPNGTQCLTIPLETCQQAEAQFPNAGITDTGPGTTCPAHNACSDL